MKDLIFRCWRFEMIFLFEKLLISFLESVFLAVVKSLYALIAVGLDAARMAFSKSKIEKTAAAVVVGIVGIGFLFAPSAVGQTSSRSFLSPYVNSIEVHNHASAGFSISVDVGSGWEAFGGARFCYQNPADDLRWCRTSTFRSPVYRWPDSVYSLYPPEGTSTKSYSFSIDPLSGATFDGEGGIVSFDGLDIDITVVYIEVTDGSVSAIYSYVSYPSTYLGPFRRESYYPYLIYYGTTYINGWWYSDPSLYSH